MHTKLGGDTMRGCLGFILKYFNRDKNFRERIHEVNEAKSY